MNINSEIEKELLTYQGKTFTAPSEALGWLHEAMLRVAKKTYEAVRVEEMTKDNHDITKMEYHTMGVEHTQGRVQGFNQAANKQKSNAQAWFGEEV